MIYLDSAATSFYKPKQVEQAVCCAFHTIGNAGRGAHAPTLEASRVLYRTRAKLARLFHAESASRIAFTANVTQALNMAIDGLLHAGDHVVTTVCEHNSVLRPLYKKQENGVFLTIVSADENGRIDPQDVQNAMRENTRAIVRHHAVCCLAACDGKTGVEMEALTGCHIALLTIYDMLKAADKHMTMTDIHLVEKHGGRSGDFSYQQVTP